MSNILSSNYSLEVKQQLKAILNFIKQKHYETLMVVDMLSHMWITFEKEYKDKMIYVEIKLSDKGKIILKIYESDGLKKNFLYKSYKLKSILTVFKKINFYLA